MHNFKTVDLVQFLYNETSEKQSNAIKAALLADNNFRDEYEGLLSAKNELAAQQLIAPRRQTIDRIMQYAEKSVEIVAS